MNLKDFIKKHGNVSVNEDELKELLGIKDKKYFIPEELDLYYFVNSYGDVKCFKSSSDGTVDEVVTNNEVFRTKEEAEEHAKKQRFLLKMKRDFLDNSDDIDWSNKHQLKYNIYYSHKYNSIYKEEWHSINYGIPVTTNYSWLQEYIKRYEKEIMKYYFEIEEE